MRSRSIAAALLVLLCDAGQASAQVLSLEFHDGLVRLTAENVPVSRILGEWARVGGTRIVNGERVPGAPVTLQLENISERQALDIVLRGAAGYMVLARDGSSTGASAFDKILVLPTTSRAPAAASLPPPAPAGPVPVRNDVEIEDLDPNPDGPVPPPAFPRGRVPNLNLPANARPPVPPQDDNDGRPDLTEPPPPTPGNPFGVVPGGSRPGTINAPPPQREVNENQEPK